MKRYIGTKLIEAEKIVRVDGKMQPLDWPIPSENARVEHGYKVRYADGYESFSPKDVFEKAYMPLEHNKKLKTDAPSISQKMVEDFIAEVHVDTLGEKTTVVRAVLANGFEIVESSSCVSKENYDQNLGKDICMEKIVGKVWYLLGFLLQTAVNGVSIPRTVEPVRDLEQEYQEQVSQEQGEWSEALDSSECGCNAAEDSNADDGCTDCEECAPPVDKMWEHDGCGYRAKNYSFDSPEKLKEKMIGNFDIPTDTEKVFIHITEEREGLLQSVVIGSPDKVIPALNAVYVENVGSMFEADAPDIFKKLVVKALISNLNDGMMSAIGCKESEDRIV